jgi:hypothetical protein
MYSLTGNDTIQVAGRVLRNFGDGDVAKISYANDIVAVKRGKNGNTVYNANATGVQADVELRILRGSPDDAFLNELLTAQLADLPSFPLMDGYFVKRIGDGQQNVTFDTHIMGGGVFGKMIDVAENVEGATDPALAIYRLKFGNTQRANL